MRAGGSLDVDFCMNPEAEGGLISEKELKPVRIVEKLFQNRKFQDDELENLTFSSEVMSNLIFVLQ